MRTAVVGHVEWIEFGRVDHVPSAGEIVHATESWEEPAGGGAVAAVQLARLAGRCEFFTALGDDDLGRRARDELEKLGLDLHTAIRTAPTRKAVTLVDRGGERTIATLGERLHAKASDPLPWNRLGNVDGVYFTAGDSDALRRAREARVLVVTSRALDALEATPNVHPDAVIGSLRDPAERYDPSRLRSAPTLVVTTDAGRGGTWQQADGSGGRYAAEQLSGPVVDTYGVGDCFAAGLTYGLAAGWPLDRALSLAARAGAACATGRGPYEGLLTAGDL